MPTARNRAILRRHLVGDPPLLFVTANPESGGHQPSDKQNAWRANGKPPAS